MLVSNFTLCWVVLCCVVAGTHDVDLLESTLDKLLSLETGNCALPAYDKSQCEGLGDRVARNQWEVVPTGRPTDAEAVEAGVDIVILEGWMMGFHALDPGSGVDKPVLDTMLAECPAFALVNEWTRRYTVTWGMVDLWLVLGLSDYAELMQLPPDVRKYRDQFSVLERIIYCWRLEAEHRMIADLKSSDSGSAGDSSSSSSGLSDAAVRDFVSRFIPAYIACLGEVYEKGPRGRRKRAEEYQGHSFVGEGRGESGAAVVSQRCMGGANLAPVLLLQVNASREVVSVCEST